MMRPGVGLKYVTIGIIFVNVSVGGNLSHLVAPPVVMVEKHWNWNSLFMLQNFGWKAVIAILVSNFLFFLFFRNELKKLAVEPKTDESTQDQREVPWTITLIHLLFLPWPLVNSHYPQLSIS